MDTADFLIVGAGVFGSSTAYHLAHSHPDKRVVLVDRQRPNPSAASADYNKIIRADYPDLLYTALGLEAIELWKNDPLFKPYFHQCGILFAEEIGMGRASLANFAKLGHDAGAVTMTPEEARIRFPQFQEANWTGVEEAYFNPKSGWGEADEALRAVVTAACDAGGPLP
ncbi:hypothetical protein FSOLCH5_003687 [Fusarium solani]